LGTADAWRGDERSGGTGLGDSDGSTDRGDPGFSEGALFLFLKSGIRAAIRNTFTIG